MVRALLHWNMRGRFVHAAASMRLACVAPWLTFQFVRPATVAWYVVSHQ